MSNASAADWQDVLRRAKRARRRSVLLAVIGAGLVLAGGSTFAVGGNWFDDLISAAKPVDERSLSAEDREVLARISGGTPVSIRPDERRQLPDNSDVIWIRLLGARAGRTFYAIRLKIHPQPPNPSSSLRGDLGTKGGVVTCLASGFVDKNPRFSEMGCPIPGAGAPQFPSPRQPVMDQSVFEATVAEPIGHIFRLEGFAADGVAEVALELDDGAVTARTRVVDNIYVRRDGLPLEPVARIVAFDRDGRKIWSDCVAHGGC